jgi:hypothetical protein
MKKKSESKTAEAKKTSVRRARTRKAEASALPAAAQVEAPEKAKPVKRPKTALASPFEKKASSPLSKEAPKIPATKKTAAVKIEKRKQPTEKTAEATPPPSSLTSTPPESKPPVAHAPLRPPLPASPPPNLKTKPGKRPVRASSTPPREVKIPALLLEGDQPPPPSVSGPGARYALAPQPVRPAPLPSGGELPEAYGTGRIFLAARDPHWLYVSWDFTSEQQSRYNALSRDGHLVIRVFARNEKTPAVSDVHVHPESRSWFVHVPHAGTAYHAEIGYFDSTGKWRNTSASQSTFTPPDAPSTDATAEFATIPVDVTFQQVVEAVQQFVTVSTTEPLLEAVAAATQVQREQPADRGTAHESKVQTPELPRTSITRIGSGPPPARAQKRREPLPIEIHEGSEWSVEKTQALARMIHIDSLRRVWMGSMEITELVRRQLQEEVASITVAEKKRLRIVFGEEAAGIKMDISSPSGTEFPPERKFWFKINAELIIYGATEPDATVTIADRPIKLRPDGTFSFRFSLPDGRYQLPATAISADGAEGREARLEFSRSTEYRGDVPPHAQDSTLRPPRPEHLK